MEAVVKLERYEPPGEPKRPKPKRRRRNRRLLFNKPKRYYLKPYEKIPVPPKPCDSFLGFVHVSNSNESFKGFEDSDMLQSTVASTLHPLNEVIEEEFKVYVCSLDLHLQHVMMVAPLRKRRIRVLSLFDGISTAMYILMKKLRLDVDMYFASEVDLRAMRVQRGKWPGKVIQLGGVEQIDKSTLQALGRVDFLIGGSPCSEISLVNWRGRGLDDPASSGNLFYDFVRIKEMLEELQGQASLPLLWLFENTYNMRNSVRDKITSVLQQEPVLLCANQFLPVVRKRYFWGNVPDMRHKEFSKSARTSLTIQDVVTSGKFANFGTAKTITSNVTNQYKKAEATFLLPITEDGIPRAFTITEVETLMGFEEHYTDVDNMLPTDRLQLLAKAWCVPVVEYLLAPLKEMFL